MHVFRWNLPPLALRLLFAFACACLSAGCHDAAAPPVTETTPQSKPDSEIDGPESDSPNEPSAPVPPLPYDENMGSKELWEALNRIRGKGRPVEQDLFLQRIIELDPHDIEAIELRAIGKSLATSKEESPDRRYEGKREAIEISLDGLAANPGNRELLASVGLWIGRGLEENGLCEHFATDERLHERLAPWMASKNIHDPQSVVNNWLVVREIKYKLVERYGPEPSSDHHAFHDRAAVAFATSGYARSLANDGRFEDAAQQAWRDAERQLEENETLEFFIKAESVDDTLEYLGMFQKDNGETRRALAESVGETMRPGDLESLQAEKRRLWEQVETLHPGLHARMREVLRDALPITHRLALGTPREERSFQQRIWVEDAKQRLTPRAEDLTTIYDAAAMPKAAADLYRRLLEVERKIRVAQALRDILSLDECFAICRLEQQPEMLTAHRALNEARRRTSTASLTDEELRAAAGLYEEAFQIIEKLTRDNTDLLQSYAFMLADDLSTYRDELLQGILPAGSRLGVIYQALRHAEDDSTVAAPGRS